MEKILLCVNYSKDLDLSKTNGIADTLSGIGYNVFIMINDMDQIIDESKYPLLQTLEEVKSKGIEVAICLGGDGNLLGFARRFSHLNLPVIGLNLGTLGFLNELSMQSYERIFRDLYEGKIGYKIEERTGVYVEDENAEKQKSFAMNDVVVARGYRARIIEVEIYINGIYVDTYDCDGIVVSTPTGTTGYNLSTGGPILLPSSTNLVISPICPHSLRSRPIVVSENDNITIKVVVDNVNESSLPYLTIDGQEMHVLSPGAVINIKIRKEKCKFLVFDEEIFFRKLREKIR